MIRRLVLPGLYDQEFAARTLRVLSKDSAARTPLGSLWLMLYDTAENNSLNRYYSIFSLVSRLAFLAYDRASLYLTVPQHGILREKGISRLIRGKVDGFGYNPWIEVAEWF
jgi:hypothetical protein